MLARAWCLLYDAVVGLKGYGLGSNRYLWRRSSVPVAHFLGREAEA
jgi:hypothetical protein